MIFRNLECPFHGNGTTKRQNRISDHSSTLYFVIDTHSVDSKMVRMSVLADCLKSIVNAEKAGKRQVLIRPSSKVIIKFLSVMQKHGKFLKIMDSRL